MSGHVQSLQPIHSETRLHVPWLADPLHCLKQNNVPQKWEVPKRKQLLSSSRELLYQWRSWCTTVLMHCLVYNMYNISMEENECQIPKLYIWGVFYLEYHTHTSLTAGWTCAYKQTGLWCFLHRNWSCPIRLLGQKDSLWPNKGKINYSTVEMSSDSPMPRPL